MYTQCPHCNAIFQVSTSQLKAAAGEVRCGQCLTIFSALHHLSENIPAQTEDQSWNPAQDDGRDDNWAADTPSTATTETTEASAALFSTGIPAHQAPGETPLTDEPADTDKHQADTASHDETGIDSSDIFNEVIIEASQHHLPTEEIDRFEAFLSADTTLPADTDTNTNTDTDTDTNITEAKPATGFDETTTADDLNLGDMDDATAELDIGLLAEDVEADFSEFDEFFHAEDEKTDEITDSFAVASHLGSEHTETTSPTFVATTDDSTPETGTETRAENEAEAGAEATTENDTKAYSETPAEPRFEAYAAHETIIIEEADLAPVDSGAYTDTPGTSGAIATDTNDSSDQPAGQGPEHATAFDATRVVETVGAETSDTTPPPEASAAVDDASTGEASQADHTETHNIPSILLEELQAAKAEQLRPSNTPWVIGCLVLMLTLVLQVVYHSRNELAKDPGLRPWLVQMCQLADCSLTQPYDIKQIDIIGREVRSHPTARKALIASTTLINNADFVQPFPLLTVIFSDINGKKIAQRRFTPREYLHNSVDLAAGMMPDTPVRVELELVDPGKAAVNYEFHTELDPRNTRPLT